MFGSGSWNLWKSGKTDGGRLASRRKGSIGQTPRPRRRESARGHKLGFDRLEPRELMAVDLTQEINTLLSQGVISGTITAPDVITIGNDLTVNQAQLTFSNVAPEGQGWSGNVEVQASSASLFEGSSGQTPPFSATASSIDGNYNLGTQAMTISAKDVTINFSTLLTVDATDPTLTYTPGTSSSLDISAGLVNLSSTKFADLSGTATNLEITPEQLTLDAANATLGATENLGPLQLASPSLSLSSLDYQFASNTITGSFTLTADSASLFDNSTSSNAPPFAASISQPSATYDFTNQALDFSADNLTLGFGSLLTVTAQKPSFDYGLTDNSFDLNVASVKLTSTTFPDLTGTAANLDITPQHIKFENASVTDSGNETLGGILSFTDPSVTVANFDYEFGPNTIAGAITVSAASASLFASSSTSNQTAPFTATVNQLTGTYNFTSQSLSLEAQGLTLGFGQFLTATATNPSFTYDPGGTVPFDISAATVSLTSPEFPNAQATADKLDITPQHITLDGATLTDSATEKLGPLEIVQPSITVTNIDYEAAGNTFNASGISFSASEVGLFTDPASANPPPFSTKVDGFNVSYVFNTQTLSVSATDAEIDFGSALDDHRDGPELDAGHAAGRSGERECQRGLG